VSAEILSEYAGVLWRPELAICKGLRSQLLQLIRNRADMVKPSRRLAADPDEHVSGVCRRGAGGLPRDGEVAYSGAA